MKSMTYGVMPSREEFAAAFERECEKEGYSAFRFGNCPRMGTCELTESELWAELVKALREWEWEEETRAEEAGDWCSAVLGCLGFEWI